jgi:metal-responsive CopG/Arc/MetJ family transcriptional regulator
MKRTSISLPDDVAKAVDNYLQAQEVRPALTTLMQTALREYLSARGFPQVRRPLKTPRRTSGVSDVSVNHDYYLARDSRKVGRKAAPPKRPGATKGSRQQS